MRKKEGAKIYEECSIGKTEVEEIPCVSETGRNQWGLLMERQESIKEKGIQRMNIWFSQQMNCVKVFVVFILGRKVEAIIGGKWATGDSFKNILRFLIRDT